MFKQALRYIKYFELATGLRFNGPQDSVILKTPFDLSADIPSTLPICATVLDLLAPEQCCPTKSAGPRKVLAPEKCCPPKSAAPRTVLAHEKSAGPSAHAAWRDQRGSIGQDLREFRIR